MHILAIETSCDETAASVVDFTDEHISVVTNVVSSQIRMHAAWGGVVPQLAAREHIRNIAPVIESTLAEASLSPDDIDLIAVTQGPGLIPALTIGTQAAKTLAYVWGKPLLGIHHIEGHIYANFIGANGNDTTSENIRFPLLALVVSGGHTQLVLMRDHFQYEILGETQDDAAGEAFDKVAKIVGLPYPGGPQVATQAEKWVSQKEKITPDGVTSPSFRLPRPMLDSGDFRFSFSGLTTAVLYVARDHQSRMTDPLFIQELCYEFQEAAVDVLTGKTARAIEHYQPKTVVIAGGVSANVRLRERLQKLVSTRFPDTAFTMPEFIYSLDNAAMIGAAAAWRWHLMNEADRERALTAWKILEPNANLKLC